MRVGYARVSTLDQNLERQLTRLKEAGVKKIFQEKISGKNTDRPALKKMLAYIHEDDQVIVLSLDRLGRNNQDISDIIEYINHKKAVLRILNLPTFDNIQDKNLQRLMTNLVLEIYKYTAENERTQIRERQRQGIELAKQRGVYRGGIPQYTAHSTNPQKRHTYERITELLKDKDQGKKITIAEIARDNGVSRNLVYKIQKQQHNSKD
ncbi:Sin recombinase [Ligilactobacillus acidipiscis DSM 15836]|jgi:DNA invertase Pin-like site-specific DNA recombinase|uniref:Sin recombinase n=1 Tax=Ligilactobacillus acidipiscis DSM 15836 TaxID=1423716 RepID=A0ABR5PID0_9LACO|nr:recombinase family protein [Ligilactobacillus acidipiscis]KRM25370.1 Sin recombinase [Ligilactobacillus acidipiscis DSM 15836]GAW63333.1 resolvase [Ligilactobacillus acidipiscis]GEN21711.1 resolvase [Ligilactobacillus acidipiscis]